MVETAKWARFFAILAFILLGLMVISGFFMGSIMSAFNPGAPQMAVPGMLFGIIYLIFGAIFFIPYYYLYRFSTQTLDAFKARDQHRLEKGIENLKSHYKFIGIATIIFLGFYIIGMVIGAMAGAWMV